MSRIYSLEWFTRSTTRFRLTTSSSRVNILFTALSSTNPPSPLAYFSKNVREHIKLNVLLREITKNYIFTIKNGSPYSHYWINSYHQLSLVFLLFYVFFFVLFKYLFVKIALQVNYFSRVSIISNITIIVSNIMIVMRSIVS